MLDTRKDYFVAIEMVNIHATMELALENGAFGRLGEELIVLVRPDDQNRIRQFYELWAAESPGDLETKRYLEEALDSTATGLQRKIEKWKYELLVYWIRFKCDQAIRNGVASAEYLEEIWYKAEFPVHIMQDYAEGPGADWKGLFHEEHPFVMKVIEEMPRFEPMIMFRLCEKKCYEAA